MPTLPFGQHRNLPLEQVPDGYLKWCIGGDCNRVNRDEELKQLIKIELLRRRTAGIHVDEAPQPAFGTPATAKGDDFDPDAAEVALPVVDQLFATPPVPSASLVSHSHAGIDETRSPFERATGMPGHKAMTYAEIRRLAKTVLAEMTKNASAELMQTAHILAGARGFHDKFMEQVRDKLRPKENPLEDD
ncbi:MAG TPA: hypothetical protein VNM37_13125 [Candidatus Dormibacteraeota bacterium]|nr:hypothetical protein [Candidatus Dormibacteraeota bacterium]